MKHILPNSEFKRVTRNLIEVSDFSTQKRKISKNYGELVITKIVTINLLGAWRAGKITEVNSFYSKLRINLGFFYTETLEREFIGGQHISNFVVFTPLKEHNTKVEAVYHTKQSVRELIEEIISKNDLQNYVTYL